MFDVLTSLQFMTAHDSAGSSKGRAGKFCGTCHNFGGVENLAVPLKGGWLVHQGLQWVKVELGHLVISKS